jgi:hypothetical protein
VSPRRSPILSLVTIPLRTATGGGLYARASGVSRGFLNYFLRRFLLTFSPFSLMRKVHPQAISTGGNFMPDSCAKRAQKIECVLKNFSCAREFDAA